MRTKACIHTLSGHTNTVASIFTQGPEPQVNLLLTNSHLTDIIDSYGQSRFYDKVLGFGSW